MLGKKETRLCVHAVLSFCVEEAGGGGRMWIIERDFKARQFHEMYIGCLDERDKQAAEGSGFVSACVVKSW